MRGMRSADATVSIETYTSIASLPADADRLFAEARTMFETRSWWSIVLADALPPCAQACFVLCRFGGRPVGLFPMLRTPGRGSAGWGSFTTPYTCLYVPLIVADTDADAVFRAFGRYCRSAAITRIDALPAEWPHLNAMIGGVRAAGMAVRQFDHFGNWHETVAGLDWPGYLARRPGALRETVRRRLRKAEQMQDARFTLIAGEEGLDDGIAAFEAVYAKSWKEPEPFPTFNAALMRTAAADGILRLGLWSVDGQPAAVQFWIVEHGQATVLKLAHDEAFKAHSPGTVLTALMLRHLLDQEKIASIDFGRGDDPYKRDWAAERRQRVGLMLINPWRPSGIKALLLHALGRIRARALQARTPARGAVELSPGAAAARPVSPG